MGGSLKANCYSSAQTLLHTIDEYEEITAQMMETFFGDEPFANGVLGQPGLFFEQNGQNLLTLVSDRGRLFFEKNNGDSLTAFYQAIRDRIIPIVFENRPPHIVNIPIRLIIDGADQEHPILLNRRAIFSFLCILTSPTIYQSFFMKSIEESAKIEIQF